MGGKDVGIAIDEWAAWYFDTPYPGLYQQNTLREGILAAVLFNLFNKYSRKVRMTNIAQSVNVLGTLCLTRDEKTVLTPTYHVYRMYEPHRGKAAVNVQVDSPTLWEPALSEPSDQPQRKLRAVGSLDASASMSRDGETLVVTLVNQSPDEDMEVELRIAGTRELGRGEATILTAGSVRAYNDFDHPSDVVPHVEALDSRGRGHLSYRAPKHSVSTLVLSVD